MTELVHGVDFNVLVSNILRYGVLTSTFLIGIGLILFGVEGTWQTLPASIGQLVQSGYGRPQLDLLKLMAEVSQGNPISLVQLGLLILLSTPIARVVTSVVMFAAERDGVYVVLTVIVLSVLLLGIFVVGPIEASSSP